MTTTQTVFAHYTHLAEDGEVLIDLTVTAERTVPPAEPVDVKDELDQTIETFIDDTGPDPLDLLWAANDGLAAMMGRFVP